MDALRARFGRGTIQRGALLGETAEVGRKYRAQMEDRDERRRRQASEAPDSGLEPPDP